MSVMHAMYDPYLLRPTLIYTMNKTTLWEINFGP